MTIRRLVQTIFALLAVLVVASAVMIVGNSMRRHRLIALEEQTFQSYTLADRLRQSSDELTRFARTYVITGEPRFEQYYRDVLAIRNGDAPVPEHYERVYWDFLVATGRPPRPAGPPKSLRRRMEDAGVTPQELALLTRAQSSSDSLVRVEDAAFHAMKGEFDDGHGGFTRRGPRNQALAIRLMFDSAYHRHKAQIMAPIDSFLAATDQRRSADLAAFGREAANADFVLIIVFGSFFLVVIVAYPVLNERILKPVRSLQRQSRSVAADIDQLAAVSTGIAGGDLSRSFEIITVPLGVQRRDEMGELTRLQDSMVSRLQQTGSAIAAMTLGLRRGNEALSERNTTLDRTRAYLQNILDTTPIAVGVSVEGDFRYVNPEFREWFGAGGRRLASDFYVDPAERDRMLHSLRENGSVRGEVFRMRRADGHAIDSLSSFYPIEYDGEDAIIGWHVDITRLKEIENAVRETARAAEAATRAKSEFLAHMSHEIRTPMNAIVGYAQLLQGETALDAPQRRKVDAILASGEHLLNLVNDVLEMSRIEAGRATLSVESFDLLELIETVRTMFAEQFRGRRLSLTVEFDASAPRVIESDAGKVRQALVNLVSNAMKFTETGGAMIRATGALAGKEGSVVTLAVSDTGHGIAAEDLESIFDTFSQSAAGAHKGGSGLGLAISRSFARLLRGELTVQSRVGEGSTFSFTFAAQLPTGDQMPPSPASWQPVRLNTAGAPRTALIVDDIRGNREPLEEALTRAGMGVYVASSGEEALDTYAHLRPDVVLMDVHMPGIGGLEAIRRLRAVGSGVPVIVMTAAADQETEFAAHQAGADAVVRKPYRIRDLVATIARLLGVTTVEIGAGHAVALPVEPIGSVADLRGIPAEMASALRAACRAARASEVAALADAIAPHAPEAAAAIRRMANAFQYRQLLDALEETESNA